MSTMYHQIVIFVRLHTPVLLGEEEQLVDKHTLWLMWMSNQMAELEGQGINFYAKKSLIWFFMNVKSEGSEITRRNAILDGTVPKYRPHSLM